PPFRYTVQRLSRSSRTTPDRVDDVPQLISSSLVGEEIDGKRILGAHGLPYAVGADGPLVDAARGPVIIGTRFPKMLLQEIQGLCPEIQPGPNPDLLHLPGRRGPYTMKLPDRQGLDECRPHFWRNDKEPVRFAVIGG